MKPLRYYWKYYIKPMLYNIDPHSSEGLRIRAEKIEEDSQTKTEPKIELKKIPRPIKIIFLVLGFSFGYVISYFTKLLSYQLWLLVLVISCLLCLFLDFYFRDLLEAWGID